MLMRIVLGALCGLELFGAYIFFEKSWTLNGPHSFILFLFGLMCLFCVILTVKIAHSRN